MKKVKEGWHIIYGWEVHVNERGYIDRAIKEDINGNQTTGYIFRKCKKGGWNNINECSIDAFRAGLKRETIRIF